MLSSKSLLALLSVVALSTARPVPFRRLVPQEHSHEKILTSVRASLNLNNPDNIVDPVFGLLGNAAASQGLGQITDPDCLQQATADQAFTNAKAAGNVQGMVDALIFRALERNTGAVGLASVLCTSIQAVNPEIGALQQHQDSASPNAAAINKGITLELARQIASVGGDPLDAIQAGTFAPGQIGDPTARGNSCNDPNDAEGCIFSQNLLVPDASEEEILAAVGDAGAVDAGNNAGNNGGAAGNNNGNNNQNDNNNNNNNCPPPVTVTVTPAAPAPTAAPAPGNGNGNNNNNNNGGANGGNLQTFTGALGGARAPAVTVGGRGFVVQGSDDFLNLNAALGRSCDIQKNACANFANSAAGRASGLSVGQCDAQANDCKAAI